MPNPGDFSYTVKQQADIVRIIGEYVKLKKSGAVNFTGLCPFHSEKSPSFSVHSTRLRDIDGVIAVIGHSKILQQQPTVRSRICAHSAFTARWKCGKLGNEGAVFIEQLFCVIAPHPLFKHPQVLRIFRHPRERDLM